VKQGELMQKNRHPTYCVVERAVYKANSAAAAFPLLIALLLFAITETFLFGIPRRIGPLYQVKNMTPLTLIIITETPPSEEDWISPWVRYYFTENNERVGLFVQGDHGIRPVHPLIMQPGHTSVLFEWTPVTGTERIPPLEKLRLFHPSFIVMDEAGNTLKTLDSFAEDDFIFDEFGNIILLIRPVGRKVEEAGARGSTP